MYLRIRGNCTLQESEGESERGGGGAKGGGSEGED